MERVKYNYVDPIISKNKCFTNSPYGHLRGFFKELFYLLSNFICVHPVDIYQPTDVRVPWEPGGSTYAGSTRLAAVESMTSHHFIFLQKTL